MSEPTEYQYDVFISYSHADEEWVRNELLPWLERAGLKTFVDYRDFEPGAPLLTEMERAVLQSRKTVLVLTPAYLDSEWTEFENILVQTLDPGARRRRLLPVVLQPCEIPLRIRSLVYIDLSPPQRSEAEFQRLLRALGRDTDTAGGNGDHEKPRPAIRWSQPLLISGLSFLVGVVGNLVAALIQQDFSIIFALPRIAVILALTAVALIAGVLIQRQPSLSPSRGMVIIVVLIVLTALIAIFWPVRDGIDYAVRVQAQDTGDYVERARVTIEISGKAPLDDITDTQGLARIHIPSSHAEHPGKLIVEASGYKRYEQHINLTPDALPDVVQLERSP